MVINRYEAVTLLQRTVLKHGYDHALGKGAPARYFNGDRPLCMVGFALSLVGVKDEMMHPFGNCVRVDGVMFAKTMAKQGIHLTDGAVKVFRAAQLAQDDGAPWGEALQEATEA